jgi:DDE family transposase
VFNQFGDLERCALRAGNVHSADGWDDVLKPVVARYQGKVSRIYFRADAAFAMPAVYALLEAERIKYAIWLPANQVLQSRIGYLLTRPVGRPPHHVRRFHANQLSGPSLDQAADGYRQGRVGIPENFIPTGLKDKLIKIGAKVVSHGRYCYLPDGRGRHRTANVPRDFAAPRGATAAATTSASVRRSMSCVQ